MSVFRRATLLFLLPAAHAGAQTEIKVTCPPLQMRYDRPVISARPGEKLKIVFENKDALPHNIVFCLPKGDGANDKGLEVAQKAWELGPLGEARGWIPEDARILAHSGLVPSAGTGTFEFQAPDAPGVYPYVCTFPGHAMLMNGELRVKSAGPGITDGHFRLYLGSWDRLPDFSTLTPHREGPLPDNLLQVNLEGMANNFALDYTGKLEAPADGNYLFFMASDDGARLYIDGRQVIDNDGIHPSSDLRAGRVALKAGSHDLRVTYFEQGGQEELYLAWASLNFSETPLSKWIHPARREGARQEDNGQGIPLAPERGEPVIYRNFIDGVSPRGICTGYPNGANLCYDADQMSLAMVWRGAFIDAKRHWTDRGGGTVSPLGYDVVRLAQDKAPGLALLADGTVPWPRHEQRAEGLRFLGYKLDEKRQPVFNSRIGNVTLSEAFEPGGDYAAGTESLTRTVTLTAEGAAPGNLYLRLASGGRIAARDGGWLVEDRLRITVEKGTAQQREQPGDLLVPVTFENGSATVRVKYQWVP